MQAVTDLADRTSPALAAVVQRVLDDPGRTEAATLATVREAVDAGLVEAMIARGELDEAEGGEVVDELAGLIGDHGEQVAAVHLLRYRAPAPVSTLIRELAARRSDPERPVTLADLRAAIDGGLAAELAGKGLLDAEEADRLPVEVDALIRIHGSRALAEAAESAEDDSP